MLKNRGKPHLYFMIKNLNPDQKKALKALLTTRDSLHITGFAGTGKSHVIKIFKEVRKMMDYDIPMVASTGAAALLVNGTTFNSFFGLGIMDGSDEKIINKAFDNPGLYTRIIEAGTVIVDEVSMISAKALRLANKIAQQIRGNDKFFGGIRIIFVGDFFQLGPFSDTKQTDWIFLGECWVKAKIKKIELKKIMRSKDQEFLEHLAKVRVGKIDALVARFLDSKIYKGKIDEFDGTIIFSRNNDVDKLNYKKLKELPTKELRGATVFKGDDISVKRLKENLIIPEVLVLKIGALVMVRINNFNEGYVNGTLGHIVSINSSEMVLKKMDGSYVSVKKHTFSYVRADGQIMATAENYPVTLAWAITIHKSQGASIDKALVALDRLWLHGQAYTALSRLTSSKGLYITKWDRGSFIVDPKVLAYSKAG